MFTEITGLDFHSSGVEKQVESAAKNVSNIVYVKQE